MRGLMLLALALGAPSTIAAGTVRPPAKVLPAKTIAPATIVEWPGGAGRRSWTSGGVTATLARRLQGDAAMPTLTVSSPGKAPFRIVIDDGVAGYSSYIAIGSLAPGQSPSVVLQTYTGGAHCCIHLTAVVPVGVAFRAVDFGEWDGDHIAWPRDVSGDGIADFVFRDQRFLYAFGSYAGSWPPPLVMNIRALKPVDVSADPAFRPLYAADLEQTRKACLVDGDEFSGGACAGYLADAARLGQFDGAWAKVARTKAVVGSAYPASCADAPRPQPCYNDFSSAVRAFLREGGYLR